MEFLNHEHSKKFTELKFSAYNWINTHDRKNMAVLFIVSASDELYDSINPYFSDAGLKILEMQKDCGSSLELKTILDLTAALYDESKSFDVSHLAKLDNDMLQLALNVMKYRYSSAPTQTQYELKQTHSIINEAQIETEEFYGITGFSAYIQEKGLDFDKRKLSVYRERGLLPKPAVQVGRNAGWSGKQIDKWIEKYNNDEVVSRYKIDKD